MDADLPTTAPLTGLRGATTAPQEALLERATAALLGGIGALLAALRGRR